MFRNDTIAKLLKNGQIIQKEYDILFEDKSSWYYENEDNQLTFHTIKNDYKDNFFIVLIKILELLKDESETDLSHISFPEFNFKTLSINTCKPISFSDTTFYANANFMGIEFGDKIDFSNCTFYGEANFAWTKFTEETNFNETTFCASTSFIKATFHSSTYFNSVEFNSYADFIEANFNGHTSFNSTKFNYEASFSWAKFTKETSFRWTQFGNKADFWAVTFQDRVIFSEIHIASLDFESVRINKIDFLHIKGLRKLETFTLTNNELEEEKYKLTKSNSNRKKYFFKNEVPNGYTLFQETQLSKIHFPNKETARIIKNHFEKQNNLSQANKYFQIEQELYIDEVHKIKTEPNRIPTLTTLYLNKWVSNFGTDWVRSLLLLFMLSYLFMRLYIDFDVYLPTKYEHIKHFTQASDIQYIWTMLVFWSLLYLSTFFKSNKFILWSLISLGIITGIIGLNNYDSVLAMQNYIIQLTNPINAFKNMNLYEGIELYGAIVRIIVVTIIYQFIVAFRQNTRRK